MRLMILGTAALLAATPALAQMTSPGTTTGTAPGGMAPGGTMQTMPPTTTIDPMGTGAAGATTGSGMGSADSTGAGTTAGSTGTSTDTTATDGTTSSGKKHRRPH